MDKLRTTIEHHPEGFIATAELIENTVLDNLQIGENTYSKKIKNLINGGVYYITIETDYEKATQKIIIEP